MAFTSSGPATTTAPPDGFLKKDLYLGQDTDPLSLHRYAYVGNNPIGLIDVSGLCGSESEFMWKGHLISLSYLRCWV